MGLTCHATAMHLMVEFPGHGMVPRQRFGPIPQLFVGAASEEGTQTFLTHREVMQLLQHLKQHSDRHRVQHSGLQRAHHLEQQH